MPDTIDAKLEEIAADFDLLGDPERDWEQHYEHLIDLGRQLQPITEAERNDHNKVRGCASQVWLVSERGTDGRLRFRGDSDADIVRGLIAVALQLYSGRAPGEILAFDSKAAFERLGLASHLSRQRSNGLASMVERIRRDAARATGQAA